MAPARPNATSPEVPPWPKARPEALTWPSRSITVAGRFLLIDAYPDRVMARMRTAPCTRYRLNTANVVATPLSDSPSQRRKVDARKPSRQTWAMSNDRRASSLRDRSGWPVYDPGQGGGGP